MVILTILESLRIWVAMEPDIWNMGNLIYLSDLVLALTCGFENS